MLKIKFLKHLKNILNSFIASKSVCKDKSMKHYCLGCKHMDYCKLFH